MRSATRPVSARSAPDATTQPWWLATLAGTLVALALRPLLEEGLALLRGQHLAGVGQRLGEALGARVRDLHLLGADRLDLRRVDGRRLQRLLHRLAVGHALLVQRAHVLEGLADDVGDLLLLLGRGVGAGQRAVDALLDLLLEARRIERLAVVAAGE